MSSDYLGSVAGELADRGAAVERAWLVWVNEHARQDRGGDTMFDELHAAFLAGVECEDGNEVAAGIPITAGEMDGKAGT